MNFWSLLVNRHISPVLSFVTSLSDKIINGVIVPELSGWCKESLQWLCWWLNRPVQDKQAHLQILHVCDRGVDGGRGTIFSCYLASLSCSSYCFTALYHFTLHVDLYAAKFSPFCLVVNVTCCVVYTWLFISHTLALIGSMLHLNLFARG